MLSDILQEKIEGFQENHQNGIIVLYGPTACGKTGLSIEIGKKYNNEIISADSRQIYRGLDIGTGKITQEEMKGITHHMLDIIEVDQAFSVVEYRDKTLPILDDIWNRGKLPILCGGTGLYIDSIIYERSFGNIPPNLERRKELEEIITREGKEAVWNILSALDPEYAATLHPNNHHYVMRAIEVYESTGTSKSLIQDIPKLNFPTLFLTPYQEDADSINHPHLKIPKERQELYARIDQRVAEMFQSGLIEEVGYNISTYGADAPGLATIGYTEVVDHLTGKTPLAECISLVQQHSRNYAKRQITWNKKYST